MLLQKLLANRHIFLNNSGHAVLLQDLPPFGALPLTHSVNRNTENTALLDMPPNLLESLRASLKGAWEYLALGRNPVMEIITVQVVVNRSMKTAMASQGKAKETKLKGCLKNNAIKH